MPGTPGFQANLVVIKAMIAIQDGETLAAAPDPSLGLDYGIKALVLAHEQIVFEPTIQRISTGSIALVKTG